MADGKLTINPVQATSTANDMKALADRIQGILEDVSKRMNDINDESTGIYHGDKKPSELKAELDEYKSTFHLFHEQIIAYANQIIEIAKTMENE